MTVKESMDIEEQNEGRVRTQKYQDWKEESAQIKEGNQEKKSTKKNINVCGRNWKRRLKKINERRKIKFRRKHGRKRPCILASRGKSTPANLSGDQNVTQAGMGDELPLTAPHQLTARQGGGKERERSRGQREKWKVGGGSAGRIR